MTTLIEETAPPPLPPDPPPARRCSDVLLAAVTAGNSTQVTVGEVVEALGERSFGLLLIAIGLVNCVPAPPGLSSIAGFPLLLVALQMVAGRHTPWLPRRLWRRQFRRADLTRMIATAQPVLGRIEKFCRPRYVRVFDVAGPRVLGAYICLLAISVMIPLPFTNFFPSLAAVVIAMAMIERDGLLLGLGVIGGFGALILSTIITATTVGVAWMGLKALIGG